MNQGVRGEAYSSKALIRSGPPEKKDAALDMVITSSSSEAVRGLAPVRSSSSRPAKTPRVFVADGRWARLVLE